jgi:type III pantothenate kinase
MILLLDLGNTRSKYAICKDENILTEGVLFDLSPASFYSIPFWNEITKILISSVVKVPKESELLIRPRLYQLTPELKSKNYSIDSLGEDRKYLALGGGANSLVICLGTCITYNVTNDAHEFYAGAISPGINLRVKSMSDGTVKLPKIDIEEKFPRWGTDTRSNLLAGVMAGIEYEILGFVADIKKSQPDIKVILTGGDAPYFAHLFPVDMHLVWKGMLHIIK